MNGLKNWREVCKFNENKNTLIKELDCIVHGGSEGKNNWFGSYFNETLNFFSILFKIYTLFQVDKDIWNDSLSFKYTFKKIIY